MELCNYNKLIDIEYNDNQTIKIILGLPRKVGKTHLLFRGWGRSHLESCRKKAKKTNFYKKNKTPLIIIGWGREIISSLFGDRLGEVR